MSDLIWWEREGKGKEDCSLRNYISGWHHLLRQGCWREKLVLRLEMS